MSDQAKRLPLLRLEELYHGAIKKYNVTWSFYEGKNRIEIKAIHE